MGQTSVEKNYYYDWDNQLLVGFQFLPTTEELVKQYLMKVLGNRLPVSDFLVVDEAEFYSTPPMSSGTVVAQIRPDSLHRRRGWVRPLSPRKDGPFSKREALGFVWTRLGYVGKEGLRDVCSKKGGIDRSFYLV